VLKTVLLPPYRSGCDGACCEIEAERMGRVVLEAVQKLYFDESEFRIWNYESKVDDEALEETIKVRAGLRVISIMRFLKK
jgi:hypothetical protein